MDPDQTPHYVESDLSPNILHMISSDSPSISMSDLGPNYLHRLSAESASASDLELNCVQKK